MAGSSGTLPDSVREALENQVVVGGDDIFGRAVERLADEDPDGLAKLTKDDVINRAAKEIHGKLEILLRSDNVTLLLGAGCSMMAGGVSLATIPWQFEKLLLEQGLTATSTEPWLELFYQIVHALTGESLTPADRWRELDDFEKSTAKGKKWQKPIEVNIEEFLNWLHSWMSGFLEDELEVSAGTGNLVIRQEDLDWLIHWMTETLVRLCRLPLRGKESSLNDHKKLLRKLLRRPLNLRRASLFTLNYDTLLEQAADAEGIVFLNGFVGTLLRCFRPESYDHDIYFPGDTTEGKVHRLERVLHLYKLHGSLTWRKVEPSWNNPYGVEELPENNTSTSESVLVYPTPLKYGEVLGFPYSEMFRRFANNVVRPQSVLFVLGYSFGDEHVNAIIRQAMAIPSFNLVVVNPNASGDFVSKLEDADDKRVWIVRGWDLGTFSGFVDKILPDLEDEESHRKIIDTYNKIRR